MINSFENENSMSPVFVVGSGRSGTTIIKRCLAQSKSVFSTNFEPMIFSSFDEKWGLAYLLQSSGRDDRLKGCLSYLRKRFKFESGSKEYGFHTYVNRDKYNELLRELEEIDLSNHNETAKYVRSFCVNLYSSMSSGKRYWLDDHIINGLFIPEIIKVFPEAKFIHPIRDGREVAKSFVRKGWARSSFEQSLKIWHSRIGQTRALAREYCPRSYLEIDFSHLTQEYPRVLQEVCDFVGVKSNANMTSLFSSDRAGQFSSDFSAEENRYFNALVSGVKDNLK